MRCAGNRGPGYRRTGRMRRTESFLSPQLPSPFMRVAPFGRPSDATVAHRVTWPLPALNRRSLRGAWVAYLACGTLACAETTPDSPPSAEGAALTEVLAWGATIPLEETAEVINVTPEVTPDPRGGFIVSDARESQVRLYRSDGKLLRYFGSKGYGPTEFQSVSSALRVPTGDLLVTDMGGKVALFDSTGAKLVRTAQAPLGPLYNSAVVNDSLVAFTGRARGRQTASPLVHLWDIRTDSIVRSFFPVPAHPEELAGAYRYSGFTDVDARGDTIAVLFALSDTVYLYDISGRPIEKIAIPSRHFRTIREKMPQDASLPEFTEWSESYSAASQLFWASDGSFVVQYFDRHGGEPQWRLLRMTRTGERMVELKDTPKLLALVGADPTLYFVQPDSPAPNVWAAARFAQR